MFDPERDEEPSRGPYYLRLLVVMVVTVAACLALWPSVSGFSAGPDHNIGCLAIKDGWRAEKAGPNLDDIPVPAPPALRQQVNDFLDWQDGPGACVPQSRHRLILSGIGLASITVIVAGGALRRRTRTNLRRPPALAGT